MHCPAFNHPDRLFPADTKRRAVARSLYDQVQGLPIVSPHSHVDPAWFAKNECFPGVVDLLIKPDHYLLRMLYSQGTPLETLGVPSLDGSIDETDARKVWRVFASQYYLFAGTPSRVWLDQVFNEVFELDEQLGEKTADFYFNHINEKLGMPEFRPRALFDRFNIETLATTDSPLDSLKHHQTIRESGWNGKVIPTYRPDPVTDPEFEGFANNLRYFGELTGQDVSTWSGYLEAHRKRRAYFRTIGATASDHGHPSALTADLSKRDCEALYQKALRGDCSAKEAEVFRAQVLTEMAEMSLEDSMVLQIHPGSYRNHNLRVFNKFGRDKGADMPTQTEFVRALKPLLDKYGNEPDLSIILFTLDESVYSREIAPLAGHYPCLKLGPSWWFHDSPEGMRRFRQLVTETAGFYNLVGFNDDTRSFITIPSRHDMARRIDCSFLAGLVAEHRLDMDEAGKIAVNLAYTLVKQSYQL
jgi:glucuronate isomerase